ALVSHAVNSQTTEAPQSWSGDPTPDAGLALSDDGRFLAYTCKSYALVTGQADGNGGDDVFLYDRTTRTNTLVSHSADSATTTMGGFQPSISSDGRFVAFANGQLGGRQDVYLFDRLAPTAAPTLLSHSAGSPTTSAGGLNAAVSASGNCVAFDSSGIDLVGGKFDANVNSDGFVYHRTAGSLKLLSLRDPNLPSPMVGGSVSLTYGASTSRSVTSADGRYVVFSSSAPNLVAGQVDSNGSGLLAGLDIFLRDQVTGTTALVSHVPGSPKTAASSASTDEVISRDGNFVAFISYGGDLVGGQSFPPPNVYLYNRVTSAVTLVSHAAGSATAAGNFGSYTPSISDDGRYVAFVSYGTNLVASQTDSNNNGDVFLYDRVTGTVT